MIARGLYVITSAGSASPAGFSRTKLIEHVRSAIHGGAKIVQYRDKSGDLNRRADEVQALKSLCDELDVMFLINDDVQLCLALDAKGVHLGLHDASLVEARRMLGSESIIGVSCYNDFDLALEAQAEGADYVAFGSFFPSPTKPDAVRADIGLLHRAREELKIPVVAIGGITPENGGQLVEAGADMLAVISGVFEHHDVEAAARRYSRLF